MAKKVKTIKGVSIDWDLLKIKQEISNAPTPLEVQERKQYIDNKLRRKINRAKESLVKKIIDEQKPEDIISDSNPKNALVDINTREVIDQPDIPTINENKKSVKKPRRIKKNDSSTSK